MSPLPADKLQPRAGADQIGLPNFPKAEAHRNRDWRQMHADQRIADIHTRFCLDLFHRREKALWNSAADYSFCKFKIFAVTVLKFNPYVAKLAMSARLLLMPALHLHLLADCFPVCNLSLIHI